MNYACIKAGRVENVIVADEAFIEHYLQTEDEAQFEAIVPLGESGAGIGWSYSDGAFVAPQDGE